MANVKVGPDELKMALALYEKGFTATAIARRLRVNPETVTRALRHTGLRVERGPRRRITPEDEKRAVDLYSEGCSTTQIAAAIGCEATRVQYYLRANGVQLRPAGFQQGEGHHAWKGGRIVTADGYVLVLVRPDDPYYPMAQVRTKESRYCLEHRLVMAKHLGRLLMDDETVHHVDDRDRQNNAIDNLQLRQGRHGKGAAFRCRTCGSHDVEAVELASPSSS